MKKYILIIIGGIFLVGACVLFITKERTRLAYPSIGQVHVAFLDIGQGDATYFRFGNGEDMLVDCGKDTAVVEALGRRMGYFDRTITTLVVTHPDRDHYGGCVDVLRRFRVLNVVLNGDDKPGDAFLQEFTREVEQEKSVVTFRTTTGTESIAGVSLVWLYPDHDLSKGAIVPGNTKDTGSNNGSIVFRLDTPSGHNLLMTGDMEFALEEYLLKKDPVALQSDILKIGHHGSSGSSGNAFIEIIKPTHSIISAGKDNSYGHPSKRVLERLKRNKSEIWRTDTQSDIMVVLGGSEISVLSRY
jgi:competence protein ComEC